MTGEPIWLATRVVLAIHECQIAEHGGLSGIRDTGLLESALARPRNLFAYGTPSPPELAASYAAGIVRNHPFVDGNKRTAFMAAYTFLGRNGRQLTASEGEATVAMLHLAAGELNEDEFAHWLADNVTPVTGA